MDQTEVRFRILKEYYEAEHAGSNVSLDVERLAESWGVTKRDIEFAVIYLVRGNLLRGEFVGGSDVPVVIGLTSTGIDAFERQASRVTQEVTTGNHNLASSTKSSSPDEDRLKFMTEVYRIYDESGPNVVSNMKEIGEKVGLGALAIEKVATWLADRGYIRWMSIGGGLSITPKGIDFMEKDRKARVPRPQIAAPSSNRIFIVHGHDASSKEELARILEKLGLTPVILHEQPQKGRVLIEKLEDHTSDVDYAFVLLTPDDVGSPLNAKPEQSRSRARQNVIFEFGYLMGKLGRERICCLYTGDIELPSDLEGIVYVPFEKSVHGAYEKIVTELRAAGYKLNP